MDDDRRIVAVKRDPSTGVLDIKYQERRGGTWADLRHHEPTQGPAEGCHEALNALAPFIGTPYLVRPASHGQIKVVGYTYAYQAAKESGDEDSRTVKLIGGMVGDGFTSAIPYKVPAQTPATELADALEVADEHVLAHIDGAVAQGTLPFPAEQAAAQEAATVPSTN